MHGHFIGDPQVYRSKEDREEAAEHDPITRLRDRLGLAGDEFDALDIEAHEIVELRSSSRRTAPTRSPKTRSRTSMPELTYREAVRDALAQCDAARRGRLHHG